MATAQGAEVRRPDSSTLLKRPRNSVKMIKEGTQILSLFFLICFQFLHMLYLSISIIFLVYIYFDNL